MFPLLLQTIISNQMRPRKLRGGPFILYQLMTLYVYKSRQQGVSSCRPEGLEQSAGRRRIFCIALYLLPSTENFLSGVSFSDLIL